MIPPPDPAGLRGLAMAATPGPWRVGFWSGRCLKEHVHRGSETSRADPCVYDPSFCPTEDNMIAGADGVNVVEGNYDGSVISASNAAYIAAASPSVVIGLLDENDRLSRELESMTVERERLAACAGELEAHIAKHLPARGSVVGDFTVAEEMRDDLRCALGLPVGTISTWETLIAVVERNRAQLCAVREASR
jgi:hypothetical protein